LLDLKILPVNDTVTAATHTDLTVNADAWYCNFSEEMRRHYCARRQTYYARLEFRATNSLLKMFGRLSKFVVDEYAAVCIPRCSCAEIYIFRLPL
jgi:hypothetical protein